MKEIIKSVPDTDEEIRQQKKWGRAIDIAYELVNTLGSKQTLSLMEQVCYPDE